MSFNHPKVVSGSRFNKSNDMKIIFDIQSYIVNNINHVLCAIHAQQARRSDTFKYHERIKRSNTLMDSEDIKTRKQG